MNILIKHHTSNNDFEILDMYKKNPKHIALMEYEVYHTFCSVHDIAPISASKFETARKQIAGELNITVFNKPLNN